LTPRILIFAVLLLALASLSAHAQSFDVVSVRPNNSGSGGSSENTNPGRVVAVNVPTSWLIEQAFGVKAFQISGGPGWLTTDNYDLNATTGTTKDLNDQELRPYFLALLADRYGFRFHRETREMPIYSLLVAKTGAKMTAHAGEGDSSNQISNKSGRSSIASIDISMAHLADLLSGRVDRVVIDHTELPGGYDLTLQWAPNPTDNTTDPSLFTALQEQLGLRLESAKGPTEFIVVDNLERPSEN
jgi:uncharacterized protein (TIGR03435 family)